MFATLIVATPVGAAPPSRCLATYTFGESNTDTGGGVAAGIFDLDRFTGKTFPGYPTGRASDGRLIIDFLVEAQGFKYLSPFFESTGSDFRRGVNFAIGGATVLEQDAGGWLRPFDLKRQIKQFVHFKARLFQSQGQGHKLGPDHFQKSLFVIDMGQNDLSAILNSTMVKANEVIAQMVGNFSEAVHRLSEQGARHIWVHNTGPLGCLPSIVDHLLKIVNATKLDLNGCAVGPNALASEFNMQLKSAVSQLRTELSNIKFTYVDIYTAKYNLVANATKLGFVDPMSVCYPSFFNTAPPVAGIPCDNPQAHISWDGSHYTEAANRWVAEQIFMGSITNASTSFVNACGSKAV